MSREQQTGKCPACGSYLLGWTLAEHQSGYCPRILLSPAPPQPDTPDVERLTREGYPVAQAPLPLKETA